MKKFLSVLLALAVAFTFTFGSTMSAFAANDESTFNGNVNTAQAQITETLNTSYANVVASLADETVELTGTEATVNITVSKDAWKTGAEKIKEKQLAAITARTNEIKANYSTYGDYTVNQLVALYTTESGFTAVAPIVEQTALYTALTSDADVTLAAVKAQFAVDKADALNAVKSVDLSIYSTTTPKDAVSYYDRAKKIIDTTVTNITNISLGSTATITDVADAYIALGAFAAGTIDTKTGDVTPGTAGSGKLATVRELKDSTDATKVVKYVLVQSIKTIAEENAEATSEAATKASYISQVNANAAAYLAANANATAEVAAKVAAEKDAYVAGMTEIINAAEKATDIAENAAALAKPDNTNFYYTANKELIDELVATANKYKAYKDANGNLVKDAESIDKVVANAKAAAYKNNAAWTGLDDAKSLIINGCKAITIDSAVVAQEKADIEVARKAALQDANGEDLYYAPEAEKVNALFDALLVKVDAAKTTAEVQAVYTTTDAIEGFNDIKNKAAVKNMIQGFAAFNTNQQKLEAYKTAINTGVDADDVKNADITADTMADFYATKGARTNDEVAALYNEARATIDATKTVGEIKEMKKAVEAQIAALPSTITANDAAAVEAAFNALTEYDKVAGNTQYTDVANVATLNLAIKAVAAAEKKAILDKYAALPTKVVSADKETYKALADEVKAFNDKIGDGKIYEGIERLTAQAEALETKLVEIRGLDKAAVLAAIDALPLNITLENKAAVEAARAAYDAYVAEYTDLTEDAPVGYNKNAAADFSEAQYKVLADAEAAIAALEPTYDDQDAKADLLDMSRKLTIWRTSKTSIKVTAVGSVANITDNGYTVEYKFYKKAPGAKSYKLIKTTSSNKYTYKNLKKGTNKFQVKVVVKDADGKVVASKMTYYRAAKVK